MVDDYSIKNSFRAVKADILSMQGELMNLKEQQARIIRDLEELSLKLEKSSKKISKKTSKKK